MLNLEITPVEEQGSSIPQGIVASVQINGQWIGSVRLHLSEALARRAAAAFLGVAAEEVSPEQLRDCAGELANITAGGIKRLVPPISKISLPDVGTAADASGAKGGCRRLIQTTFDHRGEKLIVTIVEAEASAQA
jgi:CheY-specific phosphatase CheX